MITQLDHVNIVVADMPVMTAFYRDLLGLVVTKQVTITGEWVEQTVGLKDVIGHVVYLEPANTEGGTRLELIHYESPAGVRPEALGQSNTQGLRHLAFKVDDIDTLTDRLRSQGVHVFSAVQTVPDAQVTYAGGMRKRLVYFHDPEGNLLELCEYKAEKAE